MPKIIPLSTSPEDVNKRIARVQKVMDATNAAFVYG